MCEGIVCLIKILKIVADILTFAATIYLTTLSSKDPFKSHIIGNFTNYFKFYPNTTTNIETMCVCNNETYEHSCSKENILEGCLNISSDIIEFKPLLIRKLSSRSFCTDMQESFARNEGRRLEYIFDLRYKAIRNMSIALTIVTSVYAFFDIIIIIFQIKICCNERKNDFGAKTMKTKDRCPDIILGVVYLLNEITEIAKFVLSLILYHFIESSDIEKYDDFLDCKNVKESFFEKFEDTDKLRKCFLAFAILNIISEILDKAEDLFKKCAEAEKNIDAEKNSDKNSSIHVIN